MPYASEDAFRASLKARLSRQARDSRYSRDELARAFTLQLFVARLFRSPDADKWVLTGGTALQFRAPDQARPTADADLATQLDRDDLTRSLAAVAAPREGEYGHFEVSVEDTDTSGLYTGRLRYLLGNVRFSDATLDLATHRQFLFAPEDIRPHALVVVDELAQMPPIRVNTAAEALADKVAALYELHGSSGTTPSTRAHDLVDLVIISRTQRLNASNVRTAIAAEETRRGIHIPVPLITPNPAWERDYPDRARHSGLPSELHSLPAALTAANTFLTPVLTTTNPGEWNPTQQRWTTARRAVRALLDDTHTPSTSRSTPGNHTTHPPAAPDNAPHRQHDNGYEP
ncbi:MAG: nucleotidyl transferase AbiEii/AbiGii toxin family protein [Gordonia polyisoprenivorans]|nr:nucleotidyl transferase AbiEii/AbiGii toxin family protein [Gordonia polyisoprenivorans]